MISKKYSIDLIMLSKFGKNDGGREVWAYNFLPVLLQDEKIKLNIFGYRTKEEDNTQLLVKLDKSNVSQVEAILVTGKNNIFPKFLSMFLSLKKTLKKTDIPLPDYTIAMGIIELVILLLNKRFKNGVTIVWLRTIFLNEKSYRIPNLLAGCCKKIEFFLLNKVDILLANGNDIKEYYEEYGLEVVVIKNGVNREKWSMPSPNLSGIIQVAYIGRLSKVKGIESFMELTQRIKKGKFHNYFEFHIVGDAYDYLSEVKEFESIGWIKYHGCINNNDLPIFLEKIDVCVALTYASASFGGGGTSNALLEQMAASKIIVAWNNKIFRQLLNNECAYLVEQGSIDELAEALINIYSNRDKAIKKGESAEVAIRPYTIELQVDKFLKVLNKGDGSTL